MGRKRWKRELNIDVAAEIEDRAPYVYYLCHGSEVVYVGQSERVLGRMGAHISGKRGKVFDRVLYRKCSSRAEMYEVEQSEIRRLRPRYNVRHNPDVERPERCGLCGRSSIPRGGFLIQGKDGKPVWLCCRDGGRDCLYDYQKIHSSRYKGETP